VQPARPAAGAGELNRYGRTTMRHLIFGALFLASTANAVTIPDCNPPSRSLSATEAAGLGISVLWDTAYGPKAVCQTLLLLAPKQVDGRNGEYVDIHLSVGPNRLAEFSTSGGLNDVGQMPISFNVCPPVDGIVAVLWYGAKRCDVHEIRVSISRSPSGSTLSTVSQNETERGSRP
jgi:hypothetical protein